MLLWLWCRPVSSAPIGPLDWEPPYAMSTKRQRDKKKKKKKKKKEKKTKKKKKKKKKKRKKKQKRNYTVGYTEEV